MSQKNLIRYTLSRMIEGRQEQLEDMYSGRGIKSEEEGAIAFKHEDETASLRVISRLINAMPHDVSEDITELLTREGWQDLANKYYELNPNE